MLSSNEEIGGGRLISRYHGTMISKCTLVGILSAASFSWPWYGVREASAAPGLSVERARLIAAVQRDAGPTFDVVHRDGALTASNKPQGLVAEFSRGIRIHASEDADAWSFSLEATTYGCDSNLQPLKPIPPRAVGNRVTRSHHLLSEWYVHGPLGVEHGFTWSRPPRCHGEKVIHLDVGGDVRPRFVDRGAVELLDTRGRAVLGYSELVVADAAGAVLPARLAVRGGDIEIRFDDRGAIYPLTIDPLVFKLEATLPNVTGKSGESFGAAVAVLGDRAVIGAKDYNGVGRVWSYRLVNGVWDSQGPVSAPITGPGTPQFGASVALVPDRLIVGADTIGMDGYVAVFKPMGLIWTQEQLLTLPGNHDFGYRIAASPERIIVSDQQTLHVFSLQNGSWIEEALIDPPMPNSSYIRGLAFDGDQVLFGTGTQGMPGVPGHAWVYVRTNGTWSLDSELVHDPDFTDDQYGWGVAIDGELAVVGAEASDLGGLSRGAAFIFRRGQGEWKQEAALPDPNGEVNGLFGFAVAVHEGLVMVGAPESGSGKVVVFAQVNGKWTVKSTLTPDKSSSQLGLALSTDGARLIAGAPEYDNGAAQIYRIQQGDLGAPCGDPSDCASAFCVDGVCCDSACDDGVAGNCQACSLQEGAAKSGTCGPAVAGHECRPSAGTCDVAETCDGAALSCPGDSFRPADTSCREAKGPCDVPEACPGDKALCPPDGFAPDDTACDGGSCKAGSCERMDNSTSGATSDDAPTTGGNPTTGTAGSAATDGPNSSGASDSSASGNTASGGATGDQNGEILPTDEGCGCATGTPVREPLLAGLLTLLLFRRRRPTH